MKAIIIIIPYLVLIGYNLGNVMCNHIPSEDRNESDGVELIREKRGDSFLDRIMKSIPFLHMSSPPNILEEEPIDRIDDDDNDDGDDDDDDDEDKSMTSENVPTFLPTVGLSDVPTSVLTKASTTMSSTATILSATSVQTATLFSSNSSTHIVSISESIDSISTTVSIVSTTSTSEMIKTTPAQTSIIIVTPSVADIKSLAPDSFMNSPFTSSAASNAMLNVTSLFTYPLSASHVSPMQISSSGILPSGVPKMAATPLVEKVDEEPVIKMMIMSGESPMLVHEYGGRLADERGFGDELGMVDLFFHLLC